MSLFDTITNEVAERFGLGDKAGSLLTALLTYIAGGEAGGLGGFLSRFQSAGLGELVASWVGSGDNTPLTEDQLTGALGGDALGQMAAHAGLSEDAAKPALAYMIPQVVDKLSPDGVAPTSLPEAVLSFIKGAPGAALGAATAALGAGAAAVGSGVEAARDLAGGAADLAADAAGGAVDLAGSAVSGVKNLAGDVAGGGSSMLFKLLPLLALALLAFLGYNYCSSAGTHDANSNKQIATNAPAPAKAPTKEASLNIVVGKDGKYVVSGAVPDQKTKDDIMAQLTAKYGAGNFNLDGLKVDANVKAPGWLANLGGVLDALKGAPGAILSLNGPDIKLEGLAGAAATGLMDKLKGLFGAGFNVALAVPVNEAVAAEEAEKKAGDALSALPANFTAEQLAEAMNLQIINFKSGDSGIPKDREDILMRSAEFIKKLPTDAKLEVGGHTDNRGAAATNSALSAKRAEAVKAFLIKAGVNAAALTAKGYGPDKPVATNDTDAGRFQNRRIEFTAVK
jgi:outer membrane protein OmpA-like peptidoglycan-associated protein/uncharacterized protein YidB (DUF937 family)